MGMEAAESDYDHGQSSKDVSSATLSHSGSIQYGFQHGPVIQKDTGQGSSSSRCGLLVGEILTTLIRKSVARGSVTDVGRHQHVEAIGR